MGTASDGRRGGVDWRQLVLVSLGLVGLLVASFLAPPPASNTGLDSGGSGDASAAADGCVVRLGADPTPGDTLAVQVSRDFDPVVSARVWFNDQYVGRTNESGLVSGQVPYQRSLNVTVETPRAASCEFTTAGEGGPAASLGVGGDRLSVPDAPDTAPAAAPRGSDTVRQRVLGTVDSTTTDEQAPQQTPSDTDTDTGQYSVAGHVSVTISGEPYPGSTVSLVATVDGVPMRNATVSVGGDAIGQTDDDGRYQLTVPDRDSASVAVSRGDFSGRDRLDVLDLTVRVRSPELLPVPGDPARIHTARDGEPVENAAITVDGQRHGTTGGNGTVAYTLPANPEQTVTAATDRQTATTSVWAAYAGTIALGLGLFVLTVVTVPIAVLLYGRGVGRAVGIVWAVFDSLFFVAVLWDRGGLLIGLGVVGVAALYHYRKAAFSAGDGVSAVVASAGTTVAGVTTWTQRVVLRLVTGIETALSRIGGPVARLLTWGGSRRPSLSVLGRHFRTWICTAAPRAIARGSGAITPKRLTATGVSGAATALAYVRWGIAGGVILGVAVVVGTVAVYSYYRFASGESASVASPSSEAETASGSASATAGSGPSLRDLWRSFARWVVPGRWRTRTPREVSRAAIERGLPRQPVEALTRAFEEVEYGGQTTESRRDRAREAYDALVNASDTEEEG
ncbi:DUF4129 domain-containing protein [Haloarcula sp. S1AR25-5A]|uniref:DUF4129 domain-containing protein n=1 Tax=Haloarcula terrestris TaxID=2950533 RepID=A0AAE4JIS4_9EURY|nr:DUF4129 domain-containing protein [Haloarcula terrestris]MDS0221584.1 DUF4129 domain-containing protein [Haloarcula terrestris]